MGTIGTFGSFGIASMALYASSAHLNVTGNNIANINTSGYCRQYLEVSAMYSSGADQFASGGNLNFGYGVGTDGISQYRDPYMDIRYRDENTSVGQLETKLDGLASLAFILDEVATGDADFGIIEAQFSEIVTRLQNLSEKAGSQEYDTLVRSACETLVQLFNSYSNKLEDAEDNQAFAYTTELEETNQILTSIRDLSEQIRTAGIYGDQALTLRDERNVLIDELSNKIGIDVVYTDEDLGNGVIVQNLTITIAGTNTELVNGIYCTQLSMEELTNMPNSSVNEDDEFNFDVNDSSNYMYLDTNGEPTNDPDLAAPWANPLYPDDSDVAWLTATGELAYSIYNAGPQLNPDYKVLNTDVIDVMDYVDNPDKNYNNLLYFLGVKEDPTGAITADGAAMLDDTGKLNISEYIATLATPADLTILKQYYAYTSDYVIDDDVMTEDDWLSGNLIYETVKVGEVVLPLSEPLGNDPTDPDWDPDTDAWFGGQYAIGVWDEEAGDWQKNEDGSYFILTTTNNPNFVGTTTTYDNGTDTTDDDYEIPVYSLIQLNNYVKDKTGSVSGQDNCYLITMSGLQDSKGNYIKDDFGLPIDGDVLLNDVVLTGALQAHRDLLVGEGEYASRLDIYMDANATTERGIPYYQNALDSLANKFAEMFNEGNSVTMSDIFATNDDGVFLDYSKPITVPAVGSTDYDPETAIVQLDSNGNPLYEILTDANGIEITTKNMEDYEQYIYENGVRNPNFTTDEDGNYVYSYDVGSGSIYEPIQALYVDENGDLVDTGVDDIYGNPVYQKAVDSAGNPIYVNASNLTVTELARLMGGNAIDGTFGDVTGTAVKSDAYDPVDMFETMTKDGDDNIYFKNSLGQVITNEDGEDITYEMAMANVSDFKILMEKGVYTSSYENISKQGNLFSNSSITNDDTGITAGNISISRDWSIGEVRIVLAKGEDPGSTNNSNVLYMVGLMDQDLQYDATDIASDAWTGKKEFFKGSFQEMLTNTVSTLAQDQQTTTVLLINSEVSALSLDNARTSVSGVDLNEEATNMMQYQKSYVAAAKLMTTLDEMIEVLLNM